MGNSQGKFTDENPFILGTQIITARTNVKTDLGAIIAENDSLRSTNAFLVSQNLSKTEDAGAASAIITAQTTIGAAQSTGQITGGGQPCAIGTSRIELANGRWKFLKNIAIEDVVITFNPLTGELSTGIVTDTFQHLRSAYCLLEFDDGKTTGIDEKGIHRYWSGADYDHVANLNSVWHWDNGWIPRRIVSRRIIEGKVIVYNFTVEGYHNYLLNHDGVSNSKQPPDLEVS